MLKGRIFPWKWDEPPNEKQFVLIIAIWTIAIYAVFLFAPRL